MQIYFQIQHLINLTLVEPFPQMIFFSKMCENEINRFF